MSLVRRAPLRYGARMRIDAAALLLWLTTVLCAQEGVPPAAAPAAASGLEAALARAGANRGQLEQALAQASGEQHADLAFVVEHMPESDLRTLGAEFLLADTKLAREALESAPWAASIPADVYREAVLPYAQADEVREPWRARLRELSLPLVAGAKTAGEAALRLNEKLFGVVNVRYSTKRRKACQSPSESIEQGLASCTGLSILLADACRSVGVPARIAGIALWPAAGDQPAGGNHTWVEVWDGSAWRFLGAAEPDPAGFDRAWFTGRARTAVAGDPRSSIRAVNWSRTGERFALPWAPEASWPHAVDVTARYTAADAAGSGGADDALKVQLARFFAATPAEQAAFSFDRNLDAELATPAGDARLRALAWSAFRAAPHESLRADFAANRVRAGDKESPYTVKQVGEKPAKGFGLVIAMHGGGGAPPEVNDSQWRIMQRYYKDHPEAGGYLYCALRAPTNEWNGFYTDYFYPLLEQLIRQFLVCADVDPDRVHAIGYSHGGYGAFAIGPKLPYRFAAVHSSAAAPTDGQTAVDGLHSLPFTFMVGEKDTAYGRRERCEAFDKVVQQVRTERPDAYPVTFLYKEGYGHGGLPDRDILPDLLKHVRVVAPAKLWWRPTDGTVRQHYWLELDAPAPGQFLHAVRDGNELTVSAENVASVRIRLDARTVDLGKPFVVRTGDRKSSHALAPSLAALCRSIEALGDPQLAGSVALEVALR